MPSTGGSDYVMVYKIELRYFHGWDDAEWTEEVEGATQPMRFERIGDAHAAIVEFFADVHAAVLDGNMDADKVLDDYRIIEAIE